LRSRIREILLLAFSPSWECHFIRCMIELHPKLSDGLLNHQDSEARYVFKPSHSAFRQVRTNPWTGLHFRHELSQQACASSESKENERNIRLVGEKSRRGSVGHGTHCGVSPGYRMRKFCSESFVILRNTAFLAS
jgi:hypothetical protein